VTPHKPKPLEIAYSMGIEVADVTMRRPSAAGSGVPEVQASPRFRPGGTTWDGKAMIVKISKLSHGC